MKPNTHVQPRQQMCKWICKTISRNSSPGWPTMHVLSLWLWHSPSPNSSHISADSVHFTSILQRCSLGYDCVSSRSLCGFASAVVEALIRIGYGMIKNKNKNGSQMNRKVWRPGRKHQLFSAWEAAYKRPSDCRRWLPRESREARTDQASLRQVPPGGELFAFWHNFKLCTKGPFYRWWHG